MFWGFYSDYILNSGVKWRSLAEQKVLTVELGERKSASFRLRPYLQQLHPIEYFLHRVELPQAAPDAVVSSFFFRFELWHLRGLDGLHARGGGLLAGDDVCYQ